MLRGSVHHNKSHVATTSPWGPFSYPLIRSAWIRCGQWRGFEADGSVNRSNTHTWPARRYMAQATRHPAIAALWSPAYRAMARALYPHIDNDTAGREPVLFDWTRSHERGWFAHQPKWPYNESGLAMHNFPRHQLAPHQQPRAWKLPIPHLDHASKGHGFHTCCLPIRMSTMIYLTGSTQLEHSGSTIVWPGSHRKMELLAASDPDRFEMLHTLADALTESGVLGIEPIELKVRPGDVLFHDMFLAHRGSENLVQGKPRLAFNMKWGLRCINETE